MMAFAGCRNTPDELPLHAWPVQFYELAGSFAYLRALCGWWVSKSNNHEGHKLSRRESGARALQEIATACWQIPKV